MTFLKEATVISFYRGHAVLVNRFLSQRLKSCFWGLNYHGLKALGKPWGIHGILNKISYEAEAAQLVGCTEAELIDNFSDHLQEIARQDNETLEQLIHKVCNLYNGYIFSEVPLTVYNPSSIVHFLNDNKIISGLSRS